MTEAGSLEWPRPRAWPISCVATCFKLVPDNQIEGEKVKSTCRPYLGLAPAYRCTHWQLQFVTHAQCDVRPTVTFPAAGHRCTTTGTRLYCLATAAHVCEQLAQGGYLTAERPWVELSTSWITSRRLNHGTARPRSHKPFVSFRNNWKKIQIKARSVSQYNATKQWNVHRAVIHSNEGAFVSPYISHLTSSHLNCTKLDSVKPYVCGKCPDPCLYYEHDVCLPVRLSVTLVDCDHIVQQKVEMSTWQDRSVVGVFVHKAACRSWPRT